MIDSIRVQLSSSVDAGLVDALLGTYRELKNHYYSGKHKPSELEAAHFCEVVVRVLDYLTTGKCVALGKPLSKLDVTWLESCSRLPQSSVPDSIRVHIPRAVYAIYGIRNRRGVGHIGGEVKPNLADSTFIVGTCDWILAELIRLYYTASLEDAQQLVDNLVVRRVPLIQHFDGFLKVLDPHLSVPDQIMVILYQKGAEGATRQQLKEWVQTNPANLSNALRRLVHDRRYLHQQKDCYFITHAGQQHVECNVQFHL